MSNFFNTMNFVLRQPSKGYRYNIDSLLLALFCQFKKQERVVDLGCGVGVLSVLAIKRGKVSEVIGVEIQEELLEFAHQNIEELHLQNSFRVIHDNWKNISKHLPQADFDLVVSNPPYRKMGSGCLSKHSQKIIAKHEVEGSLKDLLQAAKYLMKRKGRFCVIYPALRLEDFIHEIEKQKLKISRLRMIHPFLNQKATHFMAEVVFSVEGEIKVEAPLVVYQDKENYTLEVGKWLKNLE